MFFKINDRERQGIASSYLCELVKAIATHTSHLTLASSKNNHNMASQPQQSSDIALQLQVDFSWRKFHAKITDLENNSTDPIYIADFRTLKAPHFVLNSTSDDSTIGTGTLHTFSIDADYELHGQPGTLKALKRWKTEYTHRSQNFSREDGSPAIMTWNSDYGFKTWDFVCLDEQQMPVARFKSNMWATKKIGRIEFMGEKVPPVAVRDEIVVTGLTLFYCIMLRSGSILSFFGAFFAKPGPLPDGDGSQQEQDVAGEQKKGEASLSQNKIN
jgi:hypothetical protein